VQFIRRNRSTRKHGKMASKDVGFEFANLLINDKTYRANLKERLQSGTIPAMLEKRLWDYAMGKPAEKIEVEFSKDALEDKTPEQLKAYLEELILVAASLEPETKQLEE